MSELGKPYQPSGANAWALAPMAVVGGAVGVAVAPALLALVAWMYGTANAKITGVKTVRGWGVLLCFVWLLGAGLAGLVVGGAAGFVGRTLGCRVGSASRSGMWLAFLLMATGLYAYYALWTLQGLGEAGYRVVSPLEIFEFMKTYLGDRATSGQVMAYAVYALEALVYWSGVAVGLEHFMDHPYCEACGRWSDCEAGAAHLECPDVESLAGLAAALREGDLGVLEPLGPAGPTDKECIRLDVYRCGGCTAGRWVSLKQDANPGFEEQELDALGAAKQLKNLTSAKGIAKTVTAGAGEEAAREFEVKRLVVDEDFVRRYTGGEAG